MATDINRYNSRKKYSGNTSGGKIVLGVFKNFFKLLWKLFSTAFMVCFVSGLIVGVSMIIYIVGVANEPLGIDLHAAKLDLTSFIYVNDENGNPQEYQRVYAIENRVWVSYEDIPKAMRDAMVAIEDKRFREHKGVDWIRTASAVFSLATGSDSYGGSTLTQQLIKNITEDNEVSLTRKIREIFRALNLEKEYTKDEILEAYLNVVNFGSGSRGVQAAANLYFNKDIQECSIAECAAIAGITQNPAAYTPLVYPENNKKRRDTVIQAMFDQGKITLDEYNEAIEESNNMKFTYSYDDDDEDDDDEEEVVQNWYMDALYRDVIADLQEHLNISQYSAEQKLYTEGLKIYCAMDERAQTIAENAILNLETPYDKDLEVGYVMMGFDGRVLATVGSRNPRDGILLFDRASGAVLQPGSSIKPIGSYSYAIDNGYLHFSSKVQDKPMEKWDYVDGVWKSGPNNWYLYYKGEMLLPDAIEWSSNGTAVQTLDMIGVENSYKFVTNKLGFKHLDREHDSHYLAGLSIGGFYGGVTVKEMTAAYCIFGNGGRFYEPYTYYYVTDQNDKVILDNRDKLGIQAISAETATIMNRLLRYNIENCAHTGAANASVSGWEIIGKTGTTDSDKDSWFMGLSPYCAAGIWTGYDNPQRINSTNTATILHGKIMAEYLKDKEVKKFTLSSNVIKKKYCAESGLLATDSCKKTFTGYYTKDNMPGYCNWGHGGSTSSTSSMAESQTESRPSEESSAPESIRENDPISSEEPVSSDDESSSESSEPDIPDEPSSEPSDISSEPDPTDPEDPSSDVSSEEPPETQITD